jgi:O-antigen/teichoic acid export membrane protein
MISAMLQTLRSSLQSHKLSRDIAWSLGSFFMLAVSGIVINIAVTALRDAAALGVFNLAYAIYIVISQFAVWGVHYSVLRHAAYYMESAEERGRMLFTASVIALVFGILFAGLIAAVAPFAVPLFDSPDTGAAIRYASLGLVLFPLNKVLLAYLNGLREMKAFSVLQGLRYFLVMAFVSVVAATSVPIEFATLGFLFAEAVTAFGAGIILFRKHHHVHLAFSTEWVRKHLAFGTKGLAGGMFAEVNSRIDVLLIGFFLTDRLTGIYSFAAMLVDGLYHVLAMIRINFNPVLVTTVRDQNWEQAQRLRVQAARYVFPVVLTLSVLLVFAYFIMANWIVPGKGLLEGLPSLLILLCGLNLISIFVPFDNLMVVSGHPGYQAAQQVATVFVNAAVAVALLPMLGIEGAALGTATSYLVGISMLILFTRRLLGWKMITNQPPTSSRQSE